MKKNSIMHSAFAGLGLALVLLLSGCSLFGGGAPEFTQYDGAKLSIKYPKDWVKTEQSDGVEFETAQGGKDLYFSVSVTSDATGVSPEDTVNGALDGLKESSTNYSDLGRDTASYGGLSWTRGTATFDATDGGTTEHGKGIVLSASKGDLLYIIVYVAEVKEFDNLNSTTFGPMLDSFTTK